MRGFGLLEPGWLVRSRELPEVLGDRARPQCGGAEQAGKPMKADRRDGPPQVRQNRAGELTALRVAGPEQEAMRDAGCVRGREGI